MCETAFDSVSRCDKHGLFKNKIKDNSFIFYVVRLIILSVEWRKDSYGERVVYIRDTSREYE